ncbi:hypothetical protein [Legionella sp. km772]|uniref:hypothetical protein n=1 Tax=Legionella sp. km772 TaxID=2498111 RepID=UPI000F8EB4A3|nr:hypothetical protein [Legionella sp. km772]RUR05511.1 hypothetical protein ELY15_14255 [Legionella sp. km772]
MEQDKTNEAIRKALQDYEEILRKMRESLSLNAESPEQVIATTNQVNDAAYTLFLKTYELNNQKSEEAYAIYQEQTKVLDAASEEAYQSYQEKGQPSYEEYVKIKEKNDRAREDAYNLYLKSKELNDLASNKAYEHYVQQHEDNIAFSKHVLDEHNLHQDNIALSKPADTITSMVERLKEFSLEQDKAPTLATPMQESLEEELADEEENRHSLGS